MRKPFFGEIMHLLRCVPIFTSEIWEWLLYQCRRVMRKFGFIEKVLGKLTDEQIEQLKEEVRQIESKLKRAERLNRTKKKKVGK